MLYLNITSIGSSKTSVKASESIQIVYLPHTSGSSYWCPRLKLHLRLDHPYRACKGCGHQPYSGTITLNGRMPSYCHKQVPTHTCSDCRAQVNRWTLVLEYLVVPQLSLRISQKINGPGGSTLKLQMKLQMLTMTSIVPHYLVGIIPTRLGVNPLNIAALPSVLKICLQKR